MKLSIILNNKYLTIAIVLLLTIIFLVSIPRTAEMEKSNKELILLPKDFLKGRLSVFDAIETRRSIRDYSEEPITMKELSTLLYTTQGITQKGRRAAPSAGALYPIETYIIVNNVQELAKGLYHYVPGEHALRVVKSGDFGAIMRAMSLGQSSLEKAAVDFVWTAVFKRTTSKYDERGIMYIYMEAGHISENLYLQANSLGLGVVAIGAFDNNAVNEFIGVDGEEEAVIYINSVGNK